MIEIRNLLFQPLTFHLAGNEHGLHLGSRQRKLVEDAEVSEEMRTAAKGGFVVLTTLEQSDQPEAEPVAAGFAEIPSENAEQPSEAPAVDESAQLTDAPTTASDDGSAGADSETSEQPQETTDEPRSRKRR